MHRLFIFGVFMKSIYVAVAEGSTVAPERQAVNGDYIGCYDQGCLHFDKHRRVPVDAAHNVTPDYCTTSCRDNGFVFAAVYNRTICSCSCENACLIRPVDDIYCGLPCMGDVEKICGGYIGASLYRLSPGNTSDSECRQLNHDDKTSVEGPISPIDIVKVIVIVTVVPGFVVLVIITVTIAVILKKKRRSHSPLDMLDPQSQKNQSTHPSRKTPDEDLYHLYVDLAEDTRGKNIVGHGTQRQVRRSDMSDESHVYTYADQLTPLPETSIPSVGTNEAGYLTLEKPSQDVHQGPYYSSKIPTNPRRDGGNQMEPNLEMSASAVGNDEEGYITIMDDPAPSPSSGPVCYSSKIHRRPGEGEGHCSSDPLQSVYYSSHIRKPEPK